MVLRMATATVNAMNIVVEKVSGQIIGRLLFDE